MSKAENRDKIGSEVYEESSDLYRKEERCEVIQDLLPLYIDEACSKESEKLVKEHLRECLYCRNLYDNMTATVPVREIELKEIKVQKAFKKIWFSFLLLVGLFGVIVVGRTVVDYMEFHNMLHDDGLTVENWDKVELVDNTMSEWKGKGIESAVELMEPIELYMEMSKPWEAEQINQWAGVWFEEEAPHYEAFEVAGVRFAELSYEVKESRESTEQATEKVDKQAIKEELPWVAPEGFPTPVTEAGNEMKKALESGDTVQFWYLFMKEYKSQLIVTEEVYEAVTKQLEEIETAHYHRIETESGNYYYYNEIDENGSRDIGFSDYCKDMYEKVEGLQPMEDSFFVCAQSRFMPETLCEDFMEKYQQVKAQFHVYTTCYQNIGYYEFAGKWRDKIVTVIKELSEQGIVLEDYEIKRLFTPDNEDYYGTRAVCRADFTNGHSLYLYFDIDSGRVALDDAEGVYKEEYTQEERREMEAFRDKVWESLDYRMAVPR